MTEESVSIGASERFGVTLRVYPELRGVFAELRLWLHGKSLGRRDDPMAVYSFVCALEGMARLGRDEMLAAEVLHLPAADAWVRLEAEGARFKAPPIDFFDDYEMYCVTDEHTVRYLWKNCLEQDEAVHDAPLSRNEVDRVIGDLRSTYEALAASYL
jgi:hypothetical protein